MKSEPKSMISVVVCTYNRARNLRIALESLCNQTLEKSAYEVIVVDNNSTDSTREVVKDFEHHGNVRHVLETVQGLSAARNRGWREAQGDYVGYTDDDCKLPEQWLSVAQTIIQTCAPHAFGGPYFPFYLDPKPKWFKDEYSSSVLINTAGWLTAGQYLSGGNMFYQRSIIERLGGFDPKIGMAKNKRQYGDEIPLQISLYESVPNYQMYYDRDLWVYHMVKPIFMNLKSVSLDRFKRGRDAYYALFRTGTRTKSFLHFMILYTLRFVYCIGLLFFHTVIGIPFRNRTKYPYFQNYYYENHLPLLSRLGGMYEAIVKYREYA